MSHPAEHVPTTLASVTTAAAHCELSASTVDRWRRAGRIRTYRRGRCVLVDEVEVHRLAESAQLVIPETHADPNPQSAEASSAERKQ